MLAYELFQNNKNSTTSSVGKQFPIKKIFYKNNNITIDKNGWEEYGSEITKDTMQLQNWLQMPLNTIDSSTLNLPDFRTGKAAANPYIEVYGYLKINRSLDAKLFISIEKKPNHINYILDVITGEITNKSEGKVKLKLDRKNYFLNSNSLFSEYVDSGIIDDDGILNTKTYDEIIQVFLEYAKKQKSNITKSGNSSFRIYILPDDSMLEFRKPTKKENSQQSFVDYFGNNTSEYPATPTRTAKFLTYDDKAFSINCMQKENFYKNLGIGNNSLEKIYTDASQTFEIMRRLYWTFMDLSNPGFKFIETKRGILTQLYENYRLLTKDKGDNDKAQLKILCIRINQAKQELLIDENLTMNKMEKMFSNIKKILDNSNDYSDGKNDSNIKYIPNSCFEIFIDNSGQNPIWNTYLYVVKNFLAGNKLPKNYLLSYFNKILKQNRYDWVKLHDKTEQISFFTKSDFCLKSLLKIDNDMHQYMDKNEEFAESVGKIARLYVDFKRSQKETDNSVGDILTYSKYDREKLHFIVSRIRIGVELSKIPDNDKKDMTEKISKLLPKEDIENDVSSKDYGYFFSKGYYVNLEVSL